MVQGNSVCQNFPFLLSSTKLKGKNSLKLQLLYGRSTVTRHNNNNNKNNNKNNNNNNNIINNNNNHNNNNNDNDNDDNNNDDDNDNDNNDNNDLYMSFSLGEFICGCQVGLLDSICVLQKHKHFPYYELCVAYHMSADPMVSTFASNRFNDATDNFLGNSCKCFWLRIFLS